MRTLKLIIAEPHSLNSAQLGWLRHQLSQTTGVYFAPELWPEFQHPGWGFVQVLAELTRPHSKRELEQNITVAWSRLLSQGTVAIVASPVIVAAIYILATKCDFPSAEITQLPTVINIVEKQASTEVDICCWNSLLNAQFFGAAA